MLLPDAPVSIDIGSFSVKVAQLSGGRSGVRTIRFAEQALPQGFHWEAGSDVGPLVEAIRSAMKTAGIRARRAVVGLPRRHVTVRISAFPPATDRAQLANVVQYDLADHLPFPVEQVVADFQSLGPSAEQPGMTDVLVVAAPRELVQQYLQVLRAAGLKPAALTVDALALHDVAVLRGEEPPGIALAVEIGRRAATINVSSRGRLLLTRSVPLGGQQLAAAIRDDLGVSADEAEARKQSEGLRLLEVRSGLSRVSAWRDNLCGEMRRSALSFGQAVVSRLSLLGAGASIPGLVEALETEFGARPMILAPATVFPTAQLHGPDGGAAARCMLAIGQALRGLGRSHFAISLLPRDLVAQRRTTIRRRVSVVAVVAIIAAVAASYVSSQNQVRYWTGEVKRQNSTLDAQEKAAEKVTVASTESKDLERDVASLASVRASRYQVLELLRAITEGAAGQVVLTNFHLRPDQPVLIRGTAPDYTTVADLQAYLMKSPLVTSVSADRIDRPRVVGVSMMRGARAMRGARGPSLPPAPAATPASPEQVTFAMTVHLWTEKSVKAKRTTVRTPREVQP